MQLINAPTANKRTWGIRSPAPATRDQYQSPRCKVVALARQNERFQNISNCLQITCACQHSSNVQEFCEASAVLITQNQVLHLKNDLKMRRFFIAPATSSKLGSGKKTWHASENDVRKQRFPGKLFHAPLSNWNGHWGFQRILLYENLRLDWAWDLYRHHNSNTMSHCGRQNPIVCSHCLGEETTKSNSGLLSDCSISLLQTLLQGYLSRLLQFDKLPAHCTSLSHGPHQTRSSA